MLLEKVTKEWHTQIASQLNEFMGKFFKENVTPVLNLIL